jgi:LysR family transcriptional activator of nhaA
LLLLEPALRSEVPVRLSVHEHDLDKMLRELATFRLDLVLSERPAPPSTRTKCFSQELADSDVSFYGTPELASRYAADFPRSLQGAPIFLPTENLALRRALEYFFEQNNLQPKILGEFEDPALTVAFAQAGHGVFPATSLIEAELRRRTGLVAVGRLPSVREHYFAITVARKLPHPVLGSVLEQARRSFAQSADATALAAT